ncbi:hypothetical protein ABT154_21365 [Streptomyces sp. NPDC001728]|uniref:hypothetical protein n=1 Tax=Streptomyces sp. NPDC001728 TaxID=3154396 RepID=UPI0033227A48
MDTPTLHGLELSHGDHVGTDAQPRCCAQDMTLNPLMSDDLTFKCGSCSTVVVIDNQGLVFDIR